MTPEIVTVGGITLDWVIDPTGNVNVKACGGNALYSAIGAHFWCESVAVVSTVGASYPENYLKPFSESGIDLQLVQTISEPHELVTGYRYNIEGDRDNVIPSEELPDNVLDNIAQNCSLFGDGSWSSELRARVDPRVSQFPKEFSQVKGFHIGNMSFTSQIEFSRHLHKYSALYTIDAFAPSCNMDERMQLLNLAPIFLPSEAQVSWFFAEPCPNLNASLRHFSNNGPKVVAIKIGRQGSLVYDKRKDKQANIPAYPVNVVDPTGAGDAYCGGFLAGFIETGDAFEAALRATVSSSFVIEGFDARYGLRFGRKEAVERLDRLRYLLRDT